MTNPRQIFCMLIALGIVGNVALGQEIYRWTDERGVVHFGHLPPDGKTAEKQKLPPNRVRDLPDAIPDDQPSEAALGEDGAPIEAERPEAPSEAEIDPDQGADASRLRPVALT